MYFKFKINVDIYFFIYMHMFNVSYNPFQTMTKKVIVIQSATFVLYLVVDITWAIIGLLVALFKMLYLHFRNNPLINL